MGLLDAAHSLLTNRWLAFFTGFIMMGVAGTEYLFSTYAPHLKELMDYTQIEINFLGTCGNLGIYLGFYMGIIHDFSNARVTSFLGAILLFVGWFLLYLGAVGAFQTNYIVMGVFMFIQGNGSAACYTAALANVVSKFSSESRGTVVGVLVSMYGLSSALYTPIYTYGFDSNVTQFFLFDAVVLPAIALMGVVFLCPADKVPQPAEVIPDDAPEKIKPPTRFPIKAELNSLQIFKSLDFYLLYFVFMLATGVALTLFNNLGSLVVSLGGESAGRLVSVLGIFNCAGRIVFGITSDIVGKRGWTSRATCLLFALILMATAEAYFAAVTIQHSIFLLIPGCVLLGFGFGAMMTMTPAMVNEFLGTKYFAGNNGIVRTAPALSSFLLSTVLAGELYERNSHSSEDGTQCYGWECYGYTFIIEFCILLVSIAGCLVLIFRWRRFVRRLALEQLQQTPDPDSKVNESMPIISCASNKQLYYN